ncbi:MAG: CPBP family intramembrane metalloprotease, partial [Oscillospiraceae bacterium]|nr:CPBP family intramembrane metalloprotease [Oscillospiraceae bacterium]
EGSVIEGSVLAGDVIEVNKARGESKLKPWHGIVMLLFQLAAAITLLAYVQLQLGIAGLIITELFIAAVAIVGMFLFRGTWRDLLPMAKPRLRQVIGSVVLWIAAYFAAIAASAITMAIFPSVMETSRAMSEFFADASFFIAVIVSSFLAGTCEELMHRGFILSSLRVIKSNKLKVLICGVMFGLFHLDPTRFLPTAILGALFAFIVLKTGNILIVMGLHFLHDIVALGATVLNSGEAAYEAQEAALEAASTGGMMFMTAFVMLLIAAIPFAVGMILMRDPFYSKAETP